MTTNITGGCQCGAIRFRVDGELGDASICHCRMCQKATGGFFGPYVGAPRQAVVRVQHRKMRAGGPVRRGVVGVVGQRREQFEDIVLHPRKQTRRRRG